MSYFREVDLGSSFPPFATFHEQFGFVPQLFRAQTLLPRLLEAESAIISAILFTDKALSRAQKECILLALSGARGNAYCFTLHFQMLKLLGLTEQRLDRIVADFQRADLTPQNAALLRLTLKLRAGDRALSRADASEASSNSLTDECILDAILTAALSRLFCTLSTGTDAASDFAPQTMARLWQAESVSSNPAPATDDGTGFHLRAPELEPGFAPFVFLRKQFGSVPSVFRAQTLRPDVLEAEVHAIRSLLLGEGALTRRQKELVLLAGDLSQAELAASDAELLDFAEALAGDPGSFGQRHIKALQACGFNEVQILEAVVMVGFACFFNVLQAGLGGAPEFSSLLTSQPSQTATKKAHLSLHDQRPTAVASPVDPDAECVARIREGGVDSFEELMNRHSQRVYRTLVGMLGNPDEARDALQDTFLKAFQHLAAFEGRSKFSTWLLSIAIHTGIQRLRERRPMESLDETGSDAEVFRPRQIQAWTDDPERLYSQAEMRSLIENGVTKLPAKYRVVLMLRDIEQLPIEEAASALGLGIPAIKARLLRGRLMLREALAPHFISPERKGSAKGVAF